MGSDLRERESGGTEGGAAPVPPTRGGGTVLAPSAAPSADSVGGSEAGGAREHGEARVSTGEQGKYGEAPVPEWPAGDAAVPEPALSRGPRV